MSSLFAESTGLERVQGQGHTASRTVAETCKSTTYYKTLIELHVVVQIAEGEFGGRVLCLEQSGNQAMNRTSVN